MKNSTLAILGVSSLFFIAVIILAEDTNEKVIIDFGSKDIDSNVGYNCESNIVGGVYTSGDIDGVALSISAYLQSNPSDKLKAGIYRMDSDELIGETEEIQQSKNGWNVMYFTSEVPIVADTEYLLVVHGLQSPSLRYVAGGVGSLDSVSGYSDFPEFWDGVEIHQKLAVFCQYEGYQ